MKKVILFVVIIVAVFGALAYVFSSGILNPAQKLYVAAEGDGKIVVIDPAKRKVIKEIDLSVDHEDGKLSFAPHNVQVAPDGKSVWVTANVAGHMGHANSGVIHEALAHGGEEEDGGVLNEPDEVIIINPKNDRVIKRIPIAKGAHLAHVVLSPDNAFAYVTGQTSGAIYKINTSTFTLESTIAATEASEPHGMRVSPDGKKLFIALLKGKALGVLDTESNSLSLMPVDGEAVQAGVTLDGNITMASLYDTKKLAVMREGSDEIEYIALPEEARGPVQMYPTPDSRFVYVADQGYYFEQPSNDIVYKIDLVEKRVVKSIKTGRGPHGVVISQDGKFVYVTNLLSNDVSIIDTATDEQVALVLAGREPNGISLWYKEGSGTP